LESLKNLVSNDKIKILTADLIIKEWQRNKQSRFSLIEKHKRTLEGQVSNLKSIRTRLDEEDRHNIDQVISKFQDKVQSEIENNKKHIREVEDLLNNYTIKFQITSDIKARVADWAVEKNAPFKGAKSNSTADALILFGSIDYLTEIARIVNIDEEIYLYPESIFVTGNTGDFSDTSEKEKLHADLVPCFTDKMVDGTNLAKVLNTVEELFKESEIELIEEQIEEYNAIARCGIPSR
jgi:hypothetical protein